ASATIGRGCIGIGEHWRVGPQALADARLENRYVAFRMQAAAVDDADAAMAVVAAGVDQAPHARGRLLRCHAMKVATVRDRIFAALQFSDLTPVDARRREAV